MFSLIISIIAIALVAALALASIYYGGAAFQEGSTDAEASTVINQGQQVQGAVTLATVDEKWTFASAVTDADRSALEGKYLKEIPKVREKAWTIAAVADADTRQQAELSLDGSDYELKEVCTAINEEAGETTPAAVTSISGQFGCISATSLVIYKL